MSERIPLSLLIERIANDDVADRAFVRGLAILLQRISPCLELDVIEQMGLVDVVVTFKMTERVKLIITGAPPNDLPGEVTLTVDEADFPFLQAHILDEPKHEPYEFCTLDYAFQGMPVRITGGSYQGAEGTLVVAATIGNVPKHRVRISSGVVTVAGEELEPAD